jgi:hypothetical protein
LPIVYEDVGWPEDDLAKKLRFPLIQRVYMESWKAPEACEEVGSEK